MGLRGIPIVGALHPLVAQPWGNGRANGFGEGKGATHRQVAYAKARVVALTVQSWGDRKPFRITRGRMEFLVPLGIINLEG